MVNILIAEDDIDDYSMMQEAIENILSDFTIRHSRNGKEVLEAVGNNFTPDIIFLDLNMPKMKGIDCLIALRKLKQLTQTPIIIYSTSSDFEDIDTCYKYGCTLYLVKPPSFRHLLVEMKRILLHDGPNEALLEKKISERTGRLNKLNQELELSNKKLDQYATIASHDLQEPLRKIRTFAKLLNQRHAAGTSPEVKDLLSRINQASERMSALITDVLQFSRITHPERAFTDTDLDKILGNVIQDFELSIAEKNASVEAGALPVIQAIPVQMNQLFYNLLGNALKFADRNKKPVIHISCRRLPVAEAVAAGVDKKRAWCEIVFTDNGIGFDQRFAEQVFELFERLHNSDEYPGTGIGLAMCRKIVLNHGGNISVVSAAGKGTTFRVLLPVSQQP